MPISTNDYKYCFFSFPKFNPVQEKCFPHFSSDCNLIVSSTMSSGKTAIAEAVMAYELYNKHKVCYISPLKALTKEKHDNWKNHKTFSQYALLAVSSDERVEKECFDKNQIIVSTLESFNIQLRQKNLWVKNVSVVVFDEIHLIGDSSRGADLENTIINLTLLNPRCRIVCLSGTLSNVKELATWIKKLNGKPTRFVKSQWRPTELIKTIIVTKSYNHQLKTILDIIKVSPDEKILIFVHSKYYGKRLLKYIRKEGVRAEFYHAGIGKTKRETMAKLFKDEYSFVDVLIATSALGMGVDL